MVTIKQNHNFLDLNVLLLKAALLWPLDTKIYQVPQMILQYGTAIILFWISIAQFMTILKTNDLNLISSTVDVITLTASALVKQQFFVQNIHKLKHIVHVIHNDFVDRPLVESKDKTVRPFRMRHYLRYAHLFSKVHTMSAVVLGVTWCLGPLLISPKLKLNSDLMNLPSENVTQNYGNSTNRNALINDSMQNDPTKILVDQFNRTILGSNDSRSPSLEGTLQGSNFKTKDTQKGDIVGTAFYQSNVEKYALTVTPESPYGLPPTSSSYEKHSTLNIEPAEEYPLFVYVKQIPPPEDNNMGNFNGTEAGIKELDNGPDGVRYSLRTETTESSQRESGGLNDVDLMKTKLPSGANDHKLVLAESGPNPSHTELQRGVTRVSSVAGLFTEGQSKAESSGRTDDRSEGVTNDGDVRRQNKLRRRKSPKKYTSLAQRHIMPMNVWTGDFSYINSPWFEILFAVEFWAFTISAVIYLSIDAFYFSAIYICCGQLQLLELSMKNMFPTEAEQARLTNGGGLGGSLLQDPVRMSGPQNLQETVNEKLHNQSKRDQNQERAHHVETPRHQDIHHDGMIQLVNERDNWTLCEIAQLHEKVLKLVRFIERTFTATIIVDFFHAVTSLSFALFHFQSAQGLVEFTKMYVFLFICILHQFLNNYFGEIMKYWQNRIAYATYETPWYLRDRKFKHSVSIITARTRETIMMNGLKMYILCLASFIEFMKRIFSYYTVLREISK